ncbi:MAG: hypothetical protein Rubg2KO_31870 [Rubricoccaceae bacterium]
MTVFRISFLLVFALAISACDTLTEPGLTEPGIDPGPEPEPRMMTLTLSMDRIYVEGDCDVAGINNAGEFEFDVTEDVQTMISYTNRSVYHGTPKLVHGKHKSLSHLSRSYEIAEDRVGHVTIWFESTEWDTNFGGSNIRDRDMSERSGSVSHRFRNGVWSNLGRKTIRLGSKSSCRVELRYTASVS